MSVEVCIAKQHQRMCEFTHSPLFNKRDTRSVKSQKSAGLNSTDVQDTAIYCEDFQIDGLKNRVGYNKQKNGISAVKRHLIQVFF